MIALRQTAGKKRQRAANGTEGEGEEKTKGREWGGEGRSTELIGSDISARMGMSGQSALPLSSRLPTKRSHSSSTQLRLAHLRAAPSPSLHLQPRTNSLLPPLPFPDDFSMITFAQLRTITIGKRWGSTRKKLHSSRTSSNVQFTIYSRSNSAAVLFYETELSKNCICSKNVFMFTQQRQFSSFLNTDSRPITSFQILRLQNRR